MEVLRDGKRCSELAPEDKGGEVGPCCVTVENHVNSLSSIFRSQIEIIIIAAKPGLWWWSKERNMGPFYKAMACYLSLCSLPDLHMQSSEAITSHCQVKSLNLISLIKALNTIERMTELSEVEVLNPKGFKNVTFWSFMFLYYYCN